MLSRKSTQLPLESFHRTQSNEMPTEIELVYGIYETLAKSGSVADCSLKEFMNQFEELKIATLKTPDEKNRQDNYDAMETDYVFSIYKNEIFVTGTISYQRNGGWSEFPEEAFCQSYEIPSKGFEVIRDLLSSGSQKIVYLEGIGKAEQVRRTTPKRQRTKGFFEK